MQQASVAGDPTKPPERVNENKKDLEGLQMNRKAIRTSEKCAKTLFNWTISGSCIPF